MFKLHAVGILFYAFGLHIRQPEIQNWTDVYRYLPLMRSAFRSFHPGGEVETLLVTSC